MVLEEGLDKRIKRHAICAEAFYRSLVLWDLLLSRNLTDRSNVIIAMNYIDGMDDKKFRGLLSQVFKGPSGRRIRQHEGESI